MKSALSLLFLVSFTTLVAQELPPSADPGKCYVKCITPDEFKEVTESITVTPSYTVIETEPPVYKTITERVMVKEASKKYTYVPAEYATREVEYISKEEASKLNAVPASFIDDSKEFIVFPKTGRWEYKILEDCPSANKENCMVACYVEYPEQKQVVPFKKLSKDASTESLPLDGKKSTYTLRYVKTPAKTLEEVIPAEYKDITRVVVDQPAKKVSKTIPAVTKEVKRTVLEKKGGMTVWEEIDCKLVGVNNILPILYEYNSSRITPASKKIIDENLLKLMKESKYLRIQINSHTDSRGNDEYNMALSQQRAQAVVNYLVSRGIKRSRLVAKGYGESMLINRCGNGVECTEAEHQQNRRTEFRIIQ